MPAGKNLTQPFEIVTASLRDLGEVRRLEKECFGSDAWPLIDLIAMLSFPGIIRLKAIAGDRLAGLIAGDIRRGDGISWIVTLGVYPEFRRLGIARALLRACEDRLPLNAIRLSVRRNNLSAIALYESEGYRRVGEWRGYYNDGEDALVLEKVKRSPDIMLNHS